MHFENEKLDPIEADKEFEITLRGMLVQDESRNISENIQWGIQRKFEKSEIFMKYKNFMGICLHAAIAERLIGEEWIKSVLGERVCDNGFNNESVIRSTVKTIPVCENGITICCKDGLHISVKINRQ
jgi:hypothetical protein